MKSHGVCLKSTALRDITHTPCGAAAHCTREYTRNTKFILFCVRRTLYALAYLRLIASACLFVVYWLLSIYLIAAFSWKSPQPSRG